MTKIAAFFISIYLLLLPFFGLQIYGGGYQVLYQGDVYGHPLGVPPSYHIPATLEKDAPELTYIGQVSSITKKYAEPSEELQGNHLSQWRGEVYWHEDGYLYLFPVPRLGEPYTLLPSSYVLPLPDAP